MSCIVNAINKLVSDKKRGSKGLNALFDLAKVYDSVNRGKLFIILEDRSKSSNKRRIAGFIRSLHEKVTLILGEEQVVTHTGVA